MELILAALDRTIREDGRKFGVLVFPRGAAYSTGEPELSDHRAVLRVLDRLHS